MMDGVATMSGFPPPSAGPGDYAPRVPYGGGPRYGQNFRGSYRFAPRFPMGDSMAFDGKRMRNKTVMRKTVDYNASILTYIQNRVWNRDKRDMRAIQADPLYVHQMVPPPALLETPMNSVCTRFVRQATNKIKCPIFCVCWTPEGRRLITGASSGEFTLWNGLTFNFETILQAHDTSVRSMVWSHNDQWMLTADHAGFVKYWQSNMNNVKMYQAHKDPVRGLSFCPTDAKFASCSDDGTVRIWDFLRCHEERILRGHGADVKCVDWHPQKALLVSGSKDTQQPLKLWDPRQGTALATIHAHKHTVMEVQWNRNGHWLLTASRDHLLKLFDVRNLKEELQSFKGHRKEATTVAWHPVHETLFASGGSDGQIMYWLVGHDKEVGGISEAHETMVWSLAWHPLGHLLVSGSNDHTTKFWTRNRPGDRMRDKYNLNTLAGLAPDEWLEFDDFGMHIPGMGMEAGASGGAGVATTTAAAAGGNSGGGGGGGKEEDKKDDASASSTKGIPGLDFSTPSDMLTKEMENARMPTKKVPFAKPVPKDFELAWTGGVQPDGVQPPGGPGFNAPPPRPAPRVGLLGDAPPPPQQQQPPQQPQISPQQRQQQPPPTGPPGHHQRGPPLLQGPQQGPPRHQGPPGPQQGPPGLQQGPPRHQGPPGSQQGPLRHQGPPGSQQQGPPRHQGPPGHHQGPPGHPPQHRQQQQQQPNQDYDDYEDLYEGSVSERGAPPNHYAGPPRAQAPDHHRYGGSGPPAGSGGSNLYGDEHHFYPPPAGRDHDDRDDGQFYPATAAAAQHNGGGRHDDEYMDPYHQQEQDFAPPAPPPRGGGRGGRPLLQGAPSRGGPWGDRGGSGGRGLRGRGGRGAPQGPQQGDSNGAAAPPSLLSMDLTRPGGGGGQKRPYHGGDEDGEDEGEEWGGQPQQQQQGMYRGGWGPRGGRGGPPPRGAPRGMRGGGRGGGGRGHPPPQQW